MDALVNVALQKQLFQDLLEINEAMTLGTEDVLSIIWHKGAQLIGAEHGSIRLLRGVGGRPVLVLEAHFGEGWTEEKKRRIMEKLVVPEEQTCGKCQLTWWAAQNYVIW